MPSTKDATYELIQKEINEVVQREKELKENYIRSKSLIEDIPNGFHPKPPLERAKSMLTLTNGNNNNRLFTQNVSAKGVMHRFIKSRGRMTLTSQPPKPVWTEAEPDLTKAVPPPGTEPRNGFVPVEERIRREFQDMQQREIELRSEREKSQPNLLAALNSSPEPERRSLRTTSVLQLNNFDTYKDSISAPASLKAAHSLSDLCDVNGDDEIPPRAHSLIRQWESIIKSSQTQT